MIFRVLMFLTCLAAPATAQTVQPCDWQARADAIAEPWEDNTRTYANGNVRLALIDTVEPAAGAYHVLVLSPPFGELGERQCRTVGLEQGMGFAGIDFGSLNAAYDASVGLVFELDVQRYAPDMDAFLPARLHFSVNQGTGFIGVHMQ